MPGAQEGCKPAPVGEVWYDQWVVEYLKSCGAKCDRVHMLPIFQMSLTKHDSHLGAPTNFCHIVSTF